jgi:hypothetical protein
MSLEESVEIDDDPVFDEIAKSFVVGQNWTEQDYRRHQIIEQGPASIEDISYVVETEFIPFNGNQSNYIEDEDEILFSPLAKKVMNKSEYSPVLNRKHISRSDSEDLHNRNIQEALEASRHPDENTRQISTDSFDENLNRALEMSRQEALARTASSRQRESE